MLLNLNSALSRVKLVLNPSVAVAEVYKEDVVTTKDLEASLCNHRNLARRVLC